LSAVPAGDPPLGRPCPATPTIMVSARVIASAHLRFCRTLPQHEGPLAIFPPMSVDLACLKPLSEMHGASWRFSDSTWVNRICAPRWPRLQSVPWPAPGAALTRSLKLCLTHAPRLYILCREVNEWLSQRFPGIITTITRYSGRASVRALFSHLSPQHRSHQPPAKAGGFCFCVSV